MVDAKGTMISGDVASYWFEVPQYVVLDALKTHTVDLEIGAQRAGVYYVELRSRAGHLLGAGTTTVHGSGLTRTVRVRIAVGPLRRHAQRWFAYVVRRRSRETPPSSRTVMS